MADIGLGDRVNTKGLKLYIRPSSTDIEYLQLQNKSFNPTNNILLEPTTSAGLAAYTGALNGVLSGTILFTDDFVTAIGGYKEIATVSTTTYQLPIKTWKLKLTDFGSNSQVWTCTAMLEDFNLHGEAEGGVKYDIKLRLLTFLPSDIT